jgi:hypothetical protein
MYYCTIYQQPSGRLSDKSIFEVFISLSYLDRADAESYKQTLIKQAIENGGSVYLDDGDYTTITGKIVLKPTGIDTNRAKNHYKIGIETETTKFSVLTFKSKASVPIYKTTDGLAYEVRVEELKQRKQVERQARLDEASANLKKFAAEIKPMTELYPVLRSFVRYSNQRTDKEKLATIAIKKIQELSEF